MKSVTDVPVKLIYVRIILRVLNEAYSAMKSRTVVILVLIIGSLGAYSFVLQNQVELLSKDLVNLRAEVRSIKDGLRVGPLSQSSHLNLPLDGPVAIPRLDSPLELADLYDRVKQSVVAIRTGSGAGSGWIFDSKNHIITNNHVVASFSEVEVTLNNRVSLRAKVIGKDPFSDLAVIEAIDPSIPLRPLPLGNSEQVRVGEVVVAIGNPFGFEGSISSGIISQKGRLFPSQGGYSISNMLQIDVPINPGNSGGPLINMMGEVVGVTTGAVSNTGGFSGVGFAIPASRVERVVPKLIEQGFYEHPWIGVGGVNLDRELADAMKVVESRGFLVTFLAQDGPAVRAGLRVGDRVLSRGGERIPIGGDVIIAVDGRPVIQLDDIISYIDENKSPGDPVVFGIIRDGVSREITVTLGVRPLQ